MPALPHLTLRPSPLARSPLAVVYRGWDRKRRCEVVVKVQQATEDPVALRRFGREAAVMLRLRHPSIVTLHAFHPGNPQTGDPAALVMEYVAGPTLASRVAADGRLPLKTAVQMIEEIASALNCVHALGVVHRDVKPANILLPKHGPARLTDFGVARMGSDAPLTVMGDVLGTIEYASPEQVHGGEAVGSRSDVYSLAAVSYFALTGTPPFRAADSSTQAQLSVMHRQVFSQPPPLRLHREDLPAALEEAVLRGLAKAPEARYGTAGQLAAALRAALAASPAESDLLLGDVSMRRTGAFAGALAAALLLAGISVWAVHSQTGAAATPKAALKTAALKTAALPAASASLPAALNQVFAKPALVKDAVKHSQAKLKTAKPLAVKPRRVKMPAAKPVLTAALVPPALRTLPAPLIPHLSIRLLPPKPPRVAAAPKRGWYTVSGWIALSKQPTAGKPQMVRAAPLWVKVDGHPMPSLASGQGAALPAGAHKVTFQPAAGMGAGPKTWAIRIAPSGRLNQQVPLPPTPLPEVPPHLRTPE